MSLFSWLHKQMTNRPQTPRGTARQITRRFRPQLEGLESRVVPTTWTVDTYADTGTGSLRTDINLAKSGDTIDFAPSMAGKPIMEIYGEISISKNLTIQGLGEGAYYIGLEGYKKQFAKVLGYDPYPGTLNVKLESPAQVEKKRELRAFDGLRINGFESGGRTYGGARCYRAKIGKKALPGAVLVIDRTHYDDSVLEVISSQYLRGSLKLKTGDEVRVSVDLT